MLNLNNTFFNGFEIFHATDVTNDETIVDSSTDLPNLKMPEQGNELPAARKVMLKYTPEMELELVRCILASSAHKNSSKGTNQVKYTAVVDTLWRNPLFSSKGNQEGLVDLLIPFD